jgi:hypothetical protein
MAVPAVRIDHDQVRDAANQFSARMGAVQKTLQSLQCEHHVLQGGDWADKGATTFYQAMGSQLMPTNVLASALSAAQRTTLKVNPVMAQVQDEAAHWLPD